MGLLQITSLQVFGGGPGLETLACSQWKAGRHQRETPKSLIEAMVGQWEGGKQGPSLELIKG